MTSWLRKVPSRTGTLWKTEALDFLFQQRDGKGDRGCAQPAVKALEEMMLTEAKTYKAMTPAKQRKVR